MITKKQVADHLQRHVHQHGVTTEWAHNFAVKCALEMRIRIAAYEVRRWLPEHNALVPLRLELARIELRGAQEQYAKFCRRRGLEPWT